MLRVLLSVFMGPIIRAVMVNNSAARTTSNGNIVDSHNGGFILTFNGGYYLYGISYGGCREQPEGCTNQSIASCGFQYNATLSVYWSSTLEQSSWDLVRSDILPVPPGPLRGTISRPSLVHSPHTNEWLLWWNYANVSSGGQFALAVASGPGPLGPFTLVSAPAVMPHVFIGDFTIFVDFPESVNATAWVYYTTWAPETLGQLFLAKLDPSFTRLASTGAPPFTYGPLFEGLGLMESPVLWRHGADYVFMTGHGCCFCAEGSGAYVFTSKSIGGPHKSHGNIGCNYSLPAPHVSVDSHGCLFNNVCYSSILQAELAYSFVVGTTRVLVFDRWQHAPDALKGHDPELWLPVEYTADGGLKPLRFVEAWLLNVSR